MESISSFISITQVESKPLTEQQKRWIIQNEIFELLKQDDELKRENWRRYVAFLKRYRYSVHTMGQEECIRRWKACKEKEYRKIKEMDKRTFGFFTSHLKLDDLFYIKSICSDKIQRHESPTCYIYSLQRFGSSADVS